MKLCERCNQRVARKVRLRGKWHWFCTTCWRDGMIRWPYPRGYKGWPDETMCPNCGTVWLITHIPKTHPSGAVLDGWFCTVCKQAYNIEKAPYDQTQAPDRDSLS